LGNDVLLLVPDLKIVTPEDVDLSRLAHPQDQEKDFPNFLDLPANAWEIMQLEDSYEILAQRSDERI
jgi:hypothetical protein